MGIMVCSLLWGNAGFIYLDLQLENRRWRAEAQETVQDDRSAFGLRTPCSPTSSDGPWTVACHGVLR